MNLVVPTWSSAPYAAFRRVLGIILAVVCGLMAHGLGTDSSDWVPASRGLGATGWDHATLAQGSVDAPSLDRPPTFDTSERSVDVGALSVTSMSPLVVVRGLGPVPGSRLRLACRTLLELLPVRCEVRGERSARTYAGAWVASRGQYDGRIMLEQIFADRDADAQVEVVITSRDLYEAGKPYVFGLANLSDRVAVISTARVEDGTVQAERRLTKLVLHEVGHTFGLGHHHDEGCVMRTDGTPHSLDTAPLAPCDRCRGQLVQRVVELTGPARLVLDRARAHLARGEVDRARDLLQADSDVYGQAPTHAHDFAVTLWHAGQPAEAIAMLTTSLEDHPQHAPSHASLGGMLRRNGDRQALTLALQHLLRAQALEPTWSSLNAAIAETRAALRRG